jgi:hypothetical protein
MWLISLWLDNALVVVVSQLVFSIILETVEFQCVTVL